MTGKLTRQSGGDASLDRVQAHFIQVLNPVLDNPLLDGVLLEDISLTTAYQDISHGLGRTYRGYIVVKSSANATVFSQVSADDARYVRLQGSAAVTVSLWVF